MGLLIWFGHVPERMRSKKTLNVPQQTISDQDIEAALRSVAQLVNAYGDKYWPIFERLESELDKRRSKSKRLALVLRRGNRRND